MYKDGRSVLLAFLEIIQTDRRVAKEKSYVYRLCKTNLGPAMVMGNTVTCELQCPRTPLAFSTNKLWVLKEVLNL